jgi:hypothetical protein
MRQHPELPKVDDVDLGKLGQRCTEERRAVHMQAVEQVVIGQLAGCPSVPPPPRALEPVTPPLIANITGDHQ